MDIFKPYTSKQFDDNWELWKQYKKEEHGFKFKSKISEQAALKKLARLSSTEEEAIAIIWQSMENGWKGLFKLKKSNHEITKDWVGELNQAAQNVAGK